MNEPAVETRGLTKRYGRTVGIENLDLTAVRGEVFGFLGPNGAGKTTTIRLLLDLIRPTRGEARVFGRPPRDAAVRGRIGYLPGELNPDSRMTGQATLRYFARLRVRPARGARDSGAEEGAEPGGETRVRARVAGEGEISVRGREICETLGLTGADLDRPVREYSRGMKQKLGLACAMQHDPELLVLDEPTSGLDPLVRETVFDLIRAAGREGRTVFYSSHVLSEVERTCARVGVLRSGRLLAVERLDEMRRRAVRRLTIRLAQAPPPGELDLPGATTVSREGPDVVLTVSGDLNPLLAALARLGVEQMAFPEPGLEEAFLELYRQQPEPGAGKVS